MKKLLLAGGVLFIALSAGAYFVWPKNEAVRPHVGAHTDQQKQPNAEGPITFSGVSKGDKKQAMIAHAMGTIDGVVYSNSKEAFLESYIKGFRVFEIDFITLGDGSAFGAHDGHESDYGLTGLFTDYTKDDLKDAKYAGKYTPLFVPGAVELLKEYPDTSIILDTKIDHAKVIAEFAQYTNKDPAIMDRLIPHVTDQQNLDELRAIYPFKYTMLALYRLLALRPYSEVELVDYIKRNNITAVMMNINEYDPTLAKINNRANGVGFSFRQFHNKLNAAKIPHYVHSSSDAEEIMSFLKQGVGVYSNGIWP